MIRNIVISAMAVSMMSSMASAEMDFDRGVPDIKAQISAMDVAVPEPQDKGILDWIFGKPKPKAPAEWTIMVFSSAKNDLEPYLLADLNEMEMIGSTDKVNIVAEVGRIEGYDSSDGDWSGVRRYYITRDNDKTRMGSRMLKDMGMLDQGDWRTLAAFGKWAKQAYPAKKYMLIVSNHGSGWEKGGPKALQNKWISLDEQSGNRIDTPQLAMALKEIGKVDLFSTDACLMQMAEVTYELKDYADYIVGSEETEPGDGYTYNDLLGPLAARPSMTPQELGKLTVDAYSDHYDKLNQSYTQALARASALAGLLPVTNAFVDAVMASGEKELARTARDAALSFEVDTHKDLYDFARRVVEGSRNPDVKAKGRALMDYITRTLVLHSRARDSQGSLWGGPVQYTLARGMAANFPKSSPGAGYADLQWAKDSNWDEFGVWLNN